MRVSTWLRTAAEPTVVKRSVITSFVVGTVLVVINHGPDLLAGGMNTIGLVQIVLTYLVPFVVSTATSVATLGGK
jgi:hypothetical protein